MVLAVWAGDREYDLVDWANTFWRGFHSHWDINRLLPWISNSLQLLGDRAAEQEPVGIRVEVQRLVRYLTSGLIGLVSIKEIWRRLLPYMIIGRN